jgi:hypothetical protein
MGKTILKYGLISGAISSVLMLATMPFMHQIGFDNGYYIGYTTIVLSFLLVFFGVRSYRNQYGNGQITFVKAFGVGISITLVTCIFYVATWEIIYFNFMPDFLDKYTAYEVQKVKSSGASEAVVQAKIAEVQKYKAMYDNPLWNAAFTFIEPFPVGLVMTLVSAGILRKRPRGQTLVASEVSGA